MLVVSLRGINFGFWILVSLRVFRAKRQYFELSKSRLGFCEETRNYAKRKRSRIFFFFSFLAVSFRGQILLKARPDWSPLGVKFKISDEHPLLFHIGVPPGA